LLAILNTSHVTTVQNKQGFTKALIEVRNITSQSTTQKESVLEKTIFSIAFDRNIRRLSKCQDAGDILALVRDSGRQFRAVELCHILALRNGAEICDSEALLTEFDISDITQCLVTVGSDSFVNLVHPGLRVYLQHYGKSSKCPLDLSDKNSMLAQICMSYLSSQQFSNGACTTREDLTARISKSPFLDYAAKYWHRHYAEANKSGTDMALRNAALQFLSQDGPVSSARQIMSLSQPLPKGHEQSQTQLCNGDKTPAAANDVSARQTHLNTTGLHLAIQLRLDELAIILATGKNSSTINRTDGDGETPLHLAVALEANVVAQNLVHNGGDINAQNLEGFSPWHIATANGNLSVVRMFLKQPAEGLDMNQLVSPKEDQHQSQLVTTSNGSSARDEQTAYGATALHLAARNGHVEIVRRIISDARCKELIEDCSGMTEFHKACSYGQLEVVRLLIETSAKYVRHHSKQNGRIGFHLACKYEAGYEVAKFLLEAYPDLCRIPDNNGDVALHHAAIGSVVNTVQLLLQQPDININPRNKKGQTPLALAAEYDSAALCTLYDHEGVYRWISVMGRPVEEIVRQQRERHVDS
jgi:ankyrin repeat protein